MVCERKDTINSTHLQIFSANRLILSAKQLQNVKWVFDEERLLINQFLLESLY